MPEESYDSMTKRIPVCKNMTGSREQDAEEESSASEGERETVGKPTGKTPDMQNVWDVTETVTEKRMMEEIPPSVREQVLQCLSPERREVTGESSSRTGRVRQQEVTNKSPTDHASDQENDEDKDNSSEVNCKDGQMEFIKEFQDFMNEAIERLLKKPARKHSHWKDKPELHMEQGKCKEVLCKEMEMLPPINISRDSDNERNSRILLETMDTDQCI